MERLDTVVTVLDFRRWEQGLPDAARTLTDYIEVARAVRLDAELDPVSRVKSTIRRDLRHLAARIFENDVLEPERGGHGGFGYRGKNRRFVRRTRGEGRGRRRWFGDLLFRLRLGGVRGLR
jgi:hypothetical protein